MRFFLREKFLGEIWFYQFDYRTSVCGRNILHWECSQAARDWPVPWEQPPCRMKTCCAFAHRLFRKNRQLDVPKENQKSQKKWFRKKKRQDPGWRNYSGSKSLPIKQRQGYECQGTPRDLDQECPWALTAGSGATQTSSTFIQPSQGSSNLPLLGREAKNSEQSRKQDW